MPIHSPAESEKLYYGVTTSAGAADGTTLVDTSLSNEFTGDDVLDGHSVRILTCSTTALVGQQREIWDYDVTTTTLFFKDALTAQVPTGTTYSIIRGRPSATGGPGPQPEPETEETAWILSDFDNFDVADASADTVRWSSEYISAGAADGSADINTTTTSALYANITAAALAAAEYGVRRLQTTTGNKWFTKVDTNSTVTSADATAVWAGISVSRGAAWDGNNYIRIYKRQSNAAEGIMVEYNLAGAGAVSTAILATVQDAVAFKIERIGNIWRTYYSLTLAPRHRWVLAQEIEDATNSMTDEVSIYLSVYNPEDAAGQRIRCNFDKWEIYHTLANLESIINLLVSGSNGGLAYVGRCPVGMAASTTAVVTNLTGFGNDFFNTGYQMVVLRNANSLAAAPEMEMRDITDYVSATGTFTVEAFSSNVEASDIVLVVHNTVASMATIYGIADAGSDAGTIRDAARTEANDYWNGRSVLMLSGNARHQVREVWDFLAATDDIEVRPDFGAAIAAGDVYCILSQFFPIATADATANATFVDVVGNKTDAIPAMNLAPGNDSSVAHLKAILERLGATPADPDDSALTNIGQRDDTATADDLSDVTTTSMQAKLRRLLLRFSADAFAATIQGVSRTDVEGMTSALATYFSALGAAWSVQINGQAARDNLEQVLEDLSAVLGADGANVFNPTIQGAARTDLDTALAQLATYLSAAGAAWSVQINNNAARTNLEQVLEDLSVVFGCDNANVFNPTIQGAARTDLDAALAALATYLSAAGAAWSVQVNGNAARDNLEQVIEDFIAVFGADGANVFNPTIQGAARTNLDTALQVLATYFSPLSAAWSVTMNPGAAAKDNLEQTLEDLADMLAGATGIVTFPASAAPGNNVSLAEVIRQIYDDINGGVIVPEVTETTGAPNIDESSALEQTLVTVAISARRRVGSIWLDMTNATRSFTIRVYHQIDAANMRQFAQYNWTTADPDGVLIEGFTARDDFRVTMQCDGLGAGNVSIAYAIE